MSDKVKKDLLVIHHNDLDGYGSLAVIYKKFIKMFNVVPLEFNYKTTFETLIKPFDINKLEAIFILDCNIGDEEQLKYLNSIEAIYPDKIAFIDHHEKSYELRDEMNFDHLVSMDSCGAKLTLEKFYPNERNEIYNYIDMFDRYEFDDFKEYNKSDMLSSLSSLVDKQTFVRNVAFSKDLDTLFGRYGELTKTIKSAYKDILSDEFSPILKQGENTVVYKLDFLNKSPLFYPNVNMIRLNKVNNKVTVFISKYYKRADTVKFSIRVDNDLCPELNISSYMDEKFDYVLKGGGHAKAYGGSLKSSDMTRFVQEITSIDV